MVAKRPNKKKTKRTHLTLQHIQGWESPMNQLGGDRKRPKIKRRK